MAKVNLHAAFTHIRGKLNKRDNTITRQKKYRSDSGKIIAYGAQEAYEVLNPRDYKKNPPKGQELENITSFAQASRLATLIIQAGKLTDDELATLPESEREQAEHRRQLFAHYKQRFNAQLKAPDPQAPILTKTDPQYNPNSHKIQRRQYRVLNTFIRAMLLQTLKSK